MRYRIEGDVLGKVKVPYDAYYGSETQRAIDNFKISRLRLQHEFIVAYAKIKLAAVRTNVRIVKLDSKKGAAIERACVELIDGKFQEQFVLDVFQAGAGTSTNMNLNEVIANRAIEILGGKKGSYKIINPNDDVNMSQSTNDTVPSAIRISAYLSIRDNLLPSLTHLEKALAAKSAEFKKIVKIGRTHLEDAVPITLGEEFSGYAGAVKEAISLISDASERLLELPIGGTAVGTGINAGASYSKGVISEINKITHSHFVKSKYEFTDMQDRLAELAVSDALKEAAVAINKIANDLRLLNSGPRAGLGDIKLPEVQPGSSIMPGKINPSIAEMMNMVCFQVMGCSETVTQAANSGQLEINVFMPIIGYDILLSIEILSKGCSTFADKCIRGIKPNLQKMDYDKKRNLSIATALTPYIGYKKAAEIARIAYKKNLTIREVCLQMKIMDAKKLDRILNSEKLSK